MRKTITVQVDVIVDYHFESDGGTEYAPESGELVVENLQLVDGFLTEDQISEFVTEDVLLEECEA